MQREICQRRTHAYRPDIDGLRALAVIPVIMLHAGVEFFSGGFIGVDVFFVISGFLITKIIWKDVNSGEFSIAEFYRRRARRILPALFFMLFTCGLFGLLLMLPGQFNEFTESALASLIFSANIYFALKLDYFSASASEIPLLHLWSLGVEEQFYIFFPLLLMFFSNRNLKYLILLLLLLFIVSISVAELGWRTAPQINFYIFPTRAWELLTGAIVALLIPQCSSFFF